MLDYYLQKQGSWSEFLNSECIIPSKNDLVFKFCFENSVVLKKEIRAPTRISALPGGTKSTNNRPGCKIDLSW